MASVPSRDEVKAHLHARVLTLAQIVAPDGKVQGREWLGHDSAGNKIGVVITGPKLGRWQNFHSGQAGQSGLTLIRDVLCNGDFRAAWRWALEFIGGAITERPKAIQQEAAPERKKGEPDRSVAMFLHAVPFEWDNPVGLYLQGRGIDPGLLGGIRLGALRFHPHCWNVEAQRYMPAMVAAVIDPSAGCHIAVHRTYLERHPSGRWRKASVETPKKLLGSAIGGVIPLHRGASMRRLTHAPEGDVCVLGEGIENTLSVLLEAPERRALAYVSSGNLANLQLPPAITDLVLIRDRDGLNLGVARARDRALGKWILEEGRRVTLWEPPRPYKDANDWIMGKRYAA